MVPLCGAGEPLKGQRFIFGRAAGPVAVVDRRLILGVQIPLLGGAEQLPKAPFFFRRHIRHALDELGIDVYHDCVLPIVPGGAAILLCHLSSLLLMAVC